MPKLPFHARTAIASFLGHLLLCTAWALNYGFISASPGASFVTQYVPEWSWIAMFATIGILAGIGLFQRQFLTYSMYFGALAMFIWGLGSIGAWLFLGIPSPSATWLIYIGFLKLNLAHEIHEREQTRKLAERVHKSVIEGS